MSYLDGRLFSNGSLIIAANRGPVTLEATQVGDVAGSTGQIVDTDQRAA